MSILRSCKIRKFDYINQMFLTLVLLLTPQSFASTDLTWGSYDPREATCELTLFENYSGRYFVEGEAWP